MKKTTVLALLILIGEAMAENTWRDHVKPGGSGRKSGRFYRGNLGYAAAAFETAVCGVLVWFKYKLKAGQEVSAQAAIFKRAFFVALLGFIITLILAIYVLVEETVGDPGSILVLFAAGVACIVMLFYAHGYYMTAVVGAQFTPAYGSRQAAADARLQAAIDAHNLACREALELTQQPIPSEEASAPKIEPSLAEKDGNIAPPTYCEATADSTLAKD